LRAHLFGVSKFTKAKFGHQKGRCPRTRKPQTAESQTRPSARKTKDRTEVFYYPSPIETPAGQAEKRDTYDPRKDKLYRTYLWFAILGVPIALTGLGFISGKLGTFRNKPSTSNGKSRFSKEARANG